MPLPDTPEINFIGSRARVLISGEDTGGRFDMTDMLEVPADSMPPLHVHHTHDEGFYVLEGEVDLITPDQQVTLKPGDFFLAPRGVPHVYKVGPKPARWLNVSSPAMFQPFVLAVAALDELTPEALGALATQNDMEVLGPPGTLP